MSEMSDQLKVLADYLGDDHDLAILRQLLVPNNPSLPKNPPRLKPF
uniref:Uncharacterized protein n=1 Tax=Desertifilum tharense IPPAS B-1220 TaxID=1781255 RepID=A0ACD5GXQ1_9CYAN